MKLALLDQGEFLGGAEHFLIDLLNHLTDHEIQRFNPVIWGGTSASYTSKLSKKISRENFFYPPVRGNKIQQFFHLFRLAKCGFLLQKKSKTSGITHFFSNTPRTHFAMLFSRILAGNSLPWYAYFHDFTIPPFLLRRIGKSADFLLANGVPTRQYLRSHVRPEDVSKIRIIENGFDTDSIPISTPPKQINRILMLGRIDPRKGQIYALETAHLLQERNPDVSFHIVGSPVESDERTIQYAKELQKKSAEYGLKNLTFESETSSPLEKITQYDAVLVLPTEPETFGRIVVEALVLGRLVFVFNETGPREIIRNFERFIQQQEGMSPYQFDKIPTLLVESKNPMSLAETIGFFADHPTEAEIYLRHAQSFVAKNFSITETKKRFLNLF